MDSGPAAPAAPADPASVETADGTRKLRARARAGFNESAVTPSLNCNGISHFASGAPVAGILVDGISAAERASALAALRRAGPGQSDPGLGNKPQGAHSRKTHLYGHVGVPAFWASGVDCGPDARLSSSSELITNNRTARPDRRRRATQPRPNKTKRPVLRVYLFLQKHPLFNEFPMCSWCFHQISRHEDHR